MANRRGWVALLRQVGTAAILTGGLLASESLAVAPVEGQEVTELSHPASTCHVRADTLVTLGDPSGGGMIRNESNLLALDGEGRYYLMSRPATSIQVFSADGGFLEEIGREGEGPGEFLWAQALHVEPDGELMVLDRQAQRITVFRPDRSLDRTVPFRGFGPGFHVLPTAGDSILVGGYSFTPELFGESLHVLAPDGRRVRSLGEPSHPITSRDPHGLMRALARAAGGRMWIASRDRYHIELWELDGRRRSILVRDIDWFEPLEVRADAPPPPRAVLTSLREDLSGRLWITFTVPTARWYDAAQRSTQDPHGWQMVDDDLWTNTHVEVVDPSAGTVLASARFPHRWHTHLFGDAFLGRTVVDQDAGTLRIVVLDLSLEGSC